MLKKGLKIAAGVLLALIVLLFARKAYVDAHYFDNYDAKAPLNITVLETEEVMKETPEKGYTITKFGGRLLVGNTVSVSATANSAPLAPPRRSAKLMAKPDSLPPTPNHSASKPHHAHALLIHIPPGVVRVGFLFRGSARIASADHRNPASRAYYQG